MYFCLTASAVSPRADQYLSHQKFFVLKIFHQAYEIQNFKWSSAFRIFFQSKVCKFFISNLHQFQLKHLIICHQIHQLQNDLQAQIFSSDLYTTSFNQSLSILFSQGILITFNPKPIFFK